MQCRCAYTACLANECDASDTGVTLRSRKRKSAKILALCGIQGQSTNTGGTGDKRNHFQQQPHTPSRARATISFFRHLSVANPRVRGGLVDACDAQAPDTLLRQLGAESPSALQTRPGGLYLACGCRLFKGIPLLEFNVEQCAEGLYMVSNVRRA